MATDFFVPKLGQTVEEVTLVKWLVNDGAKVAMGDPIVEVETDKAVFPVEANAKGIIHFGPYQEGDVIPVLEVIAVIGREDEKFASQAAETPINVEKEKPPLSTEPAVTSAQAPAREGGAEKVFASPRARKLAEEKGVALSQVNASGGEGTRIVERDVIAFLSQTPRVSPVAQRMASAAGVDIHEISGSGPGGRIFKDDVARALKPAAGLTAAEVSSPDVEVSERIPLKGVRGIIAERMGASVHTTARVTFFMEVDATEFVSARNRLKERVEMVWGFAPGYNDLLAKIVANSLRKFPYMNARLSEDAIEVLGHVNMGMAVDTERGLLVPVIRDADRKSLRRFGEEFRSMVDRARLGRSLPDDLSGGTFTITNLGMYDIEGFTPVINLPEAAILGVGRIIPKPVVRGEEIVVRQMWTLSLVFDHRLVDGAPAARFFQHIKQHIEEPYLLIAE